MAITTAIVLAAGEGSRLRASAPLKPLCPIAGVPLLDRALAGLGAAGTRRAVIVLGYGADAIERHLDGQDWPVEIQIVRTDARRPNGVSALAAAAALAENDQALLVMCDHLVEPALYRRVSEEGAGPGVRLGIDRRVAHPWVDPEDVTRVLTDGARIARIGKGLEHFDAHDTGVFAVGPPLFKALATLDQPSLTEGVRLLIEAKRAEVVDVSGLNWIDVDDPPALARAETWLATGEAA